MTGPGSGDAAGVIRRYRPADRQALYEVCLRTGDSGQDATGRYRNPDLLGDVFVGPYLALRPQFAFVVDDGSGAEGYVLGALDTTAFHRECEERWWPALRERYRDAPVPAGRADGWLLDWIRHPPPAAPPEIIDVYPSHLHIDLLPRWQSGGWGRRMMERLWAELEAARSPGVHLGVGTRNARAIGFYRHLGFVELGRGDEDVILGRVFD